MTKADLVLYDNDFAWDPRALDLPHVTFVKLVGLTRAEMIRLYRKAKAVLDLRLPGTCCCVTSCPPIHVAYCCARPDGRGAYVGMWVCGQDRSA